VFNSRNIGREEFVITTYKKDPWTKTFSGLFVEPCCDFKRISKSYVTKKMDREVINQIRKNRKKRGKKYKLKKYLQQ
jgi:hypothetical protein